MDHHFNDEHFYAHAVYAAHDFALPEKNANV